MKENNYKKAFEKALEEVKYAENMMLRAGFYNVDEIYSTIRSVEKEFGNKFSKEDFMTLCY